MPMFDKKIDGLLVIFPWSALPVLWGLATLRLRATADCPAGVSASACTAAPTRGEDAVDKVIAAQLDSARPGNIVS